MGEAVFPSVVVLGIGGGAFNVPNVTLAMAESADEDSGLVSGVINVSQQLGAAMGVAVLASVSASRTQRALAQGVAHAAALTDGYRVGFVVATASLLAAAGVSVLVRPRRVPADPGSTLQTAIQVTEVEPL